MKRAQTDAPFTVVPVPRELTEADVIEIIAEAEKDAALVGSMKVALVAGELKRALKLARQMCGLEEAIKD